MISEEEARAKILEVVRPLPARNVPLLEALNCFAAQENLARLPLPNFDNSAMDGYAVIANDCRPGARLRIIGEQPAGLDRQLRLSSGTAVRIFTGAPIPEGADAVVIQEEVTHEGDEIAVSAAVFPGQYIRQGGCDLSPGQKILWSGERIRATTLALLTSQGFDTVAIGGEVRVAIV